MSGETVSHYRILGRIGTGETGVVYRAEDTRTGRVFALKFLPEGASHDPEILARFQAEARIIADIDHPNIALFDVAEHEGQPFLVMEYLEGATLAETIAATGGGMGLPIEPLLRLGAQVASALDAAHANGIIHCGINPGTIFVTLTGDAKIMDFGLSRQIGSRQEDAAGSMTQEDLDGPGTPLYLSPEQVRGDELDARTDIFSLGAVLYEMATGVPPFHSITKGGVIDAILTRTPLSPSRAGLDLPPALEQAIYTAMEKNRDVRFQTAGQLRAALRRLDRQMRSAAAAAVAELPQERSYRGAAFVLIALVLLAALGFGVQRLARARHLPFERVVVGRVTYLGKVTLAALSPNGESVAYVVRDGGGESLWVRRTSEGGDTRISQPTEGAYSDLAFSGDGSYLQFARNGNGDTAFYREPVAGGFARKVFTLPPGTLGASLSPDGSRVAMLRKAALQDVALFVRNTENGGERQVAVWKAPLVPNGSLAWSRDGEMIEASVSDFIRQSTDLVEVSATGGAALRIASTPNMTVSAIRGVPGRRGIVARMERAVGVNQLWFAPRTTGEFRPIINDAADYSSPSLSADGTTLIAVQSESASRVWIASADETGLYTSGVKQVTSGNRDGSPTWLDERRIVYTVPGEKDRSGLWLSATTGGTPKQLTKPATRNVNPSACLGSYVLFVAYRGRIPHIFRSDSDGGNVRQLTVGGGEFQPSCSPDGTWFAYGSTTPEGVWRITVDGGAPVKLYDKPGVPRISPDGNWVMVRSVNSSPEVTLVSVDTAAAPRLFSILEASNSIEWSSDSQSLLYAKDEGGVGNIWMTPLSGGARKKITDFRTDLITSFSVSPGGRQLAVARQTVPVSDVVLIRDVK